MAEGAGEPRLEDFGITEEDLARAPCLLLAEHRPMVLLAAYLAAASAVFAVILHTGGSIRVAALFTAITLAAGSVLLVPLLFLAQCASERAEERWLCGRFPKLRACLAYRRAVAEQLRRPDRAAVPSGVPRGWWRDAPPEAFAAAVGRQLEAEPGARVTRLDRERTGADFELVAASGGVLVRCEPGARPVSAGVARELVAAIADRRAERAVIVTAAGAAQAFEELSVGRPITVVAPWQMGSAIRSGERGVRKEELPLEPPRTHREGG
jgi:hypothetical protein